MGMIRQVSGFFSNAWGYISDFQIDDILLPSIKGTINWFIDLFPKALGVRNTTPREQINANIIFIAFWAITSVISFGTTLGLVFIHIGLLSVGIWRWLPAVNEMWRWFRSKLPISSDYDIPLWRSE